MLSNVRGSLHSALQCKYVDYYDSQPRTNATTIQRPGSAINPPPPPPRTARNDALAIVCFPFSYIYFLICASRSGLYLAYRICIFYWRKDRSDSKRLQ